MRGKVNDMSNNEVYDNETLHQYLRGAIENGQAPKAFQLVEELIARHGRVGPSSDREAADAMLDLLQEHLDLTALVLLLQIRLDRASQRDIQVALDKARELARDFAVASDQRQTWTHMAVLLRQQLARF